MEPVKSSYGSNLSINGHLSLTVVDTDWFLANKHDTAVMVQPPSDAIVEQRDGDNIMCTAGLTALAASLVWSGIQDQATALGVTTPTYLTPLYGAVGSGAGTVAASDTQLFTELGRQTVGAGASTPATPTITAQAIWLFYFSSPTSTWTVTEAGVFANASNVTNNGTLIDHWSFSVPVTVTTANTLILQASFSVGS